MCVVESNAEYDEDPLQLNSNMGEPTRMFSFAANCLSEVYNIDVGIENYSPMIPTALQEYPIYTGSAQSISRLQVMNKR